MTGLVAPAIAQGLGALAPTLGSIIPAIGAGGFAAAATATGSVAGSVAVAASFGGMEDQILIYICCDTIALTFNIFFGIENSDVSTNQCMLIGCLL